MVDSNSDKDKLHLLTRLVQILGEGINHYSVLISKGANPKKDRPVATMKILNVAAGVARDLVIFETLPKEVKEKHAATIERLAGKLKIEQRLGD